MKSDLNSSILYGTQQHEVLSIKDRNHAKAIGEVYTDDVDECDLSDPNSLRSWRVRDRMKTVSVALVLCLNIGVDPPGVVKPNPCARMECWIDPLSMPAQRALDTIGKRSANTFSSSMRDGSLGPDTRSPRIQLLKRLESCALR